jgi:hypothetical protein
LLLDFWLLSCPIDGWGSSTNWEQLKTIFDYSDMGLVTELINSGYCRCVDTWQTLWIIISFLTYNCWFFGFVIERYIFYKYKKLCNYNCSSQLCFLVEMWLEMYKRGTFLLVIDLNVKRNAWWENVLQFFILGKVWPNMALNVHAKFKFKQLKMQTHNLEH